MSGTPSLKGLLQGIEDKASMRRPLARPLVQRGWRAADLGRYR